MYKQRKKLRSILAIVISLSLSISPCSIWNDGKLEPTIKTTVLAFNEAYDTNGSETEKPVESFKNVKVPAESETQIVVKEEPPRYRLSDSDIDLIALITMAEAEGECEEGQRLVIDTILNRLEFGCFDDTITEIIYSPKQFTCVWNGRADRCYTTEELRKMVIEELECQVNYEVAYFRTGGYGCGTPLFKVGNHYFSSL